MTSRVVHVGLRGRLDYVESLGVDALVISSVLDGNHGDAFTGIADVGYQVVNYNNVDALFGDLQDMDDLITEAHDRGNTNLKRWESVYFGWFAKIVKKILLDEPRGWDIWCYLRRFVSVSVENRCQLGTVLKILSAPLKVERIWPMVQEILSVLLTSICSAVQKGFSVLLAVYIQLLTVQKGFSVPFLTDTDTYTDF